ncbi:MAG: YbhB/YbcL family Raf kinase inhibitor-like protein [Candidatus Omnitrophica bacterium]|nr:YbhB/YbcL family Raf kinase inhibitor-like protein [Candidatus Omnitrophota bacterium]
MRISSPAFEHNAFIPVKFTCQGKGVNPPLSIEGLPKETKSLALIVDDPDAPGGDFVHWVVYDAPVTSRVEENSVFGKQGVNSLGKSGYVSPCPPAGVHRYFFKIYALDTLLNLKAGISKTNLEFAMTGHILDQAQLVGLYQKK